jgi:arginyl-tRNA synthetase
MEDIREVLRKLSKELFDTDIEPVILVPEESFGDYSTNLAMVLAKRLSRNPREVADEILDYIAKQAEIDFNCVIAGAGFINFSLHNSALLDSVQKNLADQHFGTSDIYKNQTVVSEFSDPNPFKILHIGHFYTSVVGDAISRLIEAAGGKVHRVNFGGDIGLHVAKNVWAIIKTLGGENPTKLAQVPESERSDWLAARYVEGNGAYGADDEAKLEITDLNKKLYQIVADDDHDSPLAQIYWTCRGWSYDYFDQFYQRVGIKFEKYYPESGGAAVGLPIVLEQTAKGIYQKSQGAIIFDGEPHGLHTRVFVNSDGLPTYETKDLGCDFQKWNDYHFDQQIIITANDIVEYMKVLMKSMEQFAPQIPERTLHLTHGNVKLAGGVKMSSRLGNFVKATDVLELTEQVLAEEQGNSQPELVLGAIKYAFLKNRLGPDSVYDPATSVSLSGNSGPYLQYAGARAKSILRKVGKAGEISSDEWQLDQFERALTVKLYRFPEIIHQATAELAPHQICNYLYELAGVFNRFYENSPVVANPRQNLRLNLVKLYVRTLDKGLDILGIPKMEKM